MTEARVEAHHQQAALKKRHVRCARWRASRTDYTPVWLMRQAGRYLPEYNATRARAGSFLALAKTPALATEVTLQPLERFPLDAAILFSDILTIPDAMGLGLYFAEGEGPRFERPLRDEAAISPARGARPGAELRYVFDAVRADPPRARRPRAADRLLRQPVDARLLHGRRRGQRRLAHAQDHAACAPGPAAPDPRSERRAVTRYLNAQIEAGAQAVMIFDTWGGTLAHDDYEPFSLAYARRVLEQRRSVCRRFLFTKGGNPWLARDDAERMRDAVGLDWTTRSARGAQDRRRTRRAAGKSRSGRRCSRRRSACAKPRASVLDAFGPAPGHVFNLGHGILPQTPVESVAALVDEVRAYSAQQRAKAPAKP